MGKIYFQTRAYNAEKTLKRCMDSVLNQTRYGENIIYYVCDNGSTDGTGEILREYAAKDSRIKAFYNKENGIFEGNDIDFVGFTCNLRDDDFYCVLDSDDVYELNFLEKMVPFVKEQNLDFAVCGNDFINAVNGQLTGKRVVDSPLILDTPEKFMNYFPIYHQFMRTIWGKLFTGKVAKYFPKPYQDPPKWKDITNGLDTLMSFYAMRYSSRVGIYPETLHRYYMFPKSSSRRWLSCRIESNQILHEDAEDYLLAFGSLSEQNREFLSRVYANAVSDSLTILCQATRYAPDDLLNKNKELTAADKLRELRKIIDYRETEVMFEYKNPDSQNCRKKLFYAAVNFAQGLKWENEDFTYFLSKFSPICAPFVSANEMELFLREPTLMSALYADDKSEMVDHLLTMFSNGIYAKQFDLAGFIGRLSHDRPLVSDIKDTEFIKQYDRIYYIVWNKKYVQALDKMTDMLLNINIENETFLQLYLSLAALLEGVDEFVFGKIKLAAYYCGQNRGAECYGILADLADMGVEDNDEITKIKEILAAKK